jgi:hypothetical protein
MTLALMSTSRKKNLASKQHSAKPKSMHPLGMADMRLGVAGPGLRSHLGVRLTAKGPQSKLVVNEPNDRFEQEADRVADEVMRVPNNLNPSGRSGRDDGEHHPCPSHVSLQANQAVQRLCKT